jgi:hypothetical protein
MLFQRFDHAITPSWRLAQVESDGNPSRTYWRLTWRPFAI